MINLHFFCYLMLINKLKKSQVNVLLNLKETFLLWQIFCPLQSAAPETIPRDI